MSSRGQEEKRRIKSITSIERITNATKLVASAKLNRAKAVYQRTDINLRYIKGIISNIYMEAPGIPDKYLKGNEGAGKTCYVILTGNKGMCGSYNNLVIKELEAAIKEADTEPMIVTVGSKARDHFVRKGMGDAIVTEYLTDPEHVTFVDTKEICEPIIDLFEKGEIDKVVMVHTVFITTLRQEVRRTTLLPFSEEEAKAYASEKKYEGETEYSPTLNEVFAYLMPKYMEIMLYGSMIEAATCEYAARRLTMENATDSARDMLDELRQEYNRERQAAITNQIIEVVSGAQS